MTPCPAPPELLLYALQLPDDPEPLHIAHHVSQCASCQATVMGIREVGSVLHAARADATETGKCLDEMAVANVVELGVDPVKQPDLVVHLAACARCREQVASVAGLLQDPSIAAEIRRSEVSAPSLMKRRWQVAGGGALAALAAAATFMVAGSGDRGVTERVSVTNAETHRAQSVTTTVAPDLISPIGAVRGADTFSWTSVPHADRYRLTVFDREGTAVWEAEGSDTSMAAPKSIVGERGTEYLWKVEARTGWDRWVASELVEFSLAPTGRIP